MSEPVGNSLRGGIPGNSHKDREQQKTEAEPREKAEKIIEGKVTTHKPPWWKRAIKGIMAEDATSIGDFILVDVILPAARNLIRDVVVGGMDRTLYGSSRTRRSGGGPGFGLRGDVGGIRSKYNEMSGEPRRMMSRESRARHDFDEVILDNRNEAVIVLEELIARVERYQSASVSDLYDLVGVTGSYMDQKWGWTDLRTADIRQTRGGFLLDLPRPEPLR